MMYAGRYLTAKILESRNHEIECSLSDILEDNVPEKYYLSRKQAEKLLYKENPTQGERIYSSKGLSCTLTSGSGGFGGHSGLYLIEDTENFGLPIKSKTKDGYQIAYPGDSIDTAFSGQNSRRGRVGSQIAHTLTTSATQAVFYLLPERENDRISHRSLTQSVKPVGRNESNEMDTRVHFIDLNPDPKLTKHDSGISNHKAEHSGVFVESTNIADDEKFAVAFVDPNGEVHIGRIRKLTPRECWRLQGFTDDQFDKAKVTGLSDSRLYKMAGNAVTVNVISEIGKIIKKVNDKN
jgi:site-specific DNA-cytosine methylase